MPEKEEDINVYRMENVKGKSGPELHGYLNQLWDDGWKLVCLHRGEAVFIDRRIELEVLATPIRKR